MVDQLLSTSEVNQKEKEVLGKAQEELIARLQKIGPIIEKICEVSTLPGVSIGVLHENKVIHTKGFGYRDVARKLPTNEGTIYHLCSLTKAFTGAAIGILVERGLVDWNQPIIDILPNYTLYDPAVRTEATLLDYLSHRSGLSILEAHWCQDWQDSMLKLDQLLPTISQIPLIAPLRAKFYYVNWGYVLAASIVKKLYGIALAEFWAEEIFKPLGMHRTSSERYPQGDNVAKWYQARRDGSVEPQKPPMFHMDNIMQGAAGITSTVKDLLVYYQALLKAWKHQSSTDSNSTPGSPLENARMALQGHTTLDPDSPYKQAYGIGWVISELPAPLGSVGTVNPMFVQMPVVGKGCKKQTVWHHNGSSVGAYSSVHILPESDTAIIVLTDAFANNDSADWIGQVLLETVLDNPDKNDYIKLAEESAKNFAKAWDKMYSEFTKDRIPNTFPTSDLSTYAGKYYSKAGNFHLSISHEDDKLMLKFQGRSDQAHELKHYHYDTFSWLMEPEGSFARARWPKFEKDYFLLRFERG